MAHKELLAQLLPPASYDSTGQRIAAELTAQGQVLDAAQADSLATLNAITPDGDLSMLAAWERVYDLPDPSLGSTQTVAQRLAMVQERINETGRMDRDGFLFVALNLGFSTSLNEPRPYRVNSPVGRPLYSDDWMFVWQLNAPDVTDGLPNAVLESVLRRIAPAHTVLHFNYGGDPELSLFEEGDGFLLTEDNEYLDMS